MSFILKSLNKKEKLTGFHSHIIGGGPLVLYSFNQKDFIKRGYTENGEIYSIINKIVSKCEVSTPYVYIDKEGVKSKKCIASKKGRNSVQGVAKHRLYVHKALDYAPDDSQLAKLILNPNENQTWRDLISLHRIFYFVQGEGFLYREAGDDNCAISIHIAPASLMKEIVKDGELVGWRFDLQNGKWRNFELEDVYHLEMPNPLFDDKYSQFRGLSPLLAGLKYLQLDDKAIESWIKSVENEGAKGLVSPNHPNPELWLTPDQRDLTQQRIDENVTGSANKNKVVVSGMPLQYTHIGLSPDALNIINGLKHANYQLCNLWGVPPVLFDPNPTYQNQKEAAKRFVLEVILPYLNKEEDKLNSWLVQPFIDRDKKEYKIDYDLSAYEELRLDKDEIDAMLKTHSLNEVRVMLGSDELEDEYANQVFIQQGLIPLSDYNIGQEGLP